MPDKDGWHGNAVEIDGRFYRWHYCSAGDTDTLVLDTLEARASHARECKVLARKKQKREAREAQARSMAGLKAHQREQRLVREVVGAGR